MGNTPRASSFTLRSANVQMFPVSKPTLELKYKTPFHIEFETSFSLLHLVVASRVTAVSLALASSFTRTVTLCSWKAASYF